MSRETVLVDGYNVLLALFRRERVDPDRLDFPAARADLTAVLGEWAAARRRQVVIGWDGRRFPQPGPTADPPGVSTIFLEGPAEADDWLVHEAERCAEERRPVAVVTRDREVLARLPRAARILPLPELAADLEALVQAPLSAPHVRGPAGADLLPVSRAPFDASRLPRRRAPGAADLQRPAPRRAAPADPPAAPAPAPADPRAEAAARKQLRQRRFERARKRRPPPAR